MIDTPPEIAEMVRTRLMARSGAERLRMRVEVFEVARRMVLASLPPRPLRHGTKKAALRAHLRRASPGRRIKATLSTHAAEHGLSEEEALCKGPGAKAGQFTENGSELYART